MGDAANDEFHVLDNLIYTSLSTRHAHLGLSNGTAKRFHPDVSPLCDFDLNGCIRAPTKENFEDLVAMVSSGESVGMLLRVVPELPLDGWETIHNVPCHEMVCTEINPAAVEPEDIDFAPLDKLDVPDILPLIALTRPGPFSSRTIEMGDYIGIRDPNNNNFLAAMAGERMKIPGYTEVSAVCTHPDYVGRKYAQKLIFYHLKAILGRGETALLHVRTDNERAIKLYEHLGFKIRCITTFVVLKKL